MPDIAQLKSILNEMCKRQFETDEFPGSAVAALDHGAGTPLRPTERPLHEEPP